MAENVLAKTMGAQNDHHHQHAGIRFHLCHTKDQKPGFAVDGSSDCFRGSDLERFPNCKHDGDIHAAASWSCKIGHWDVKLTDTDHNPVCSSKDRCDPKEIESVRQQK